MPANSGRGLRRQLVNTLLSLLLLALIATLWDLVPLVGMADRLAYGALGLAALVLVVRLVNALLELVVLSSLERLVEPAELASLRALLPMLRAVVWILGALVYLQNIGLQLTAVLGALAGAGIGLGLALQAPARDFFTYITILLDRPYRIGDQLRFDDVNGRVVQVGLRSTVLRSLDGELVVITNSTLLGKTIRNFADQRERRVLQRLQLDRSCRPEALAQLGDLAQQAVGESPEARFERCHVLELSPAGPVVEFCYVVTQPSQRSTAAVQEQITLALMQGLEAHGLRLADPHASPASC